VSVNNMTIWSDGLFIKPQHFQQNVRYSESQLNKRIRSLTPYFFGFSSIGIRSEDLGFGNINVSSVSAVMSDGTCIDIPHDANPPDILPISDGETNQIVYLCVPWQKENIVEVTETASDDSGARYLSDLVSVKDTSDKDGDFTNVKMGRVRTRLMLESEDRSSYCCLAICRILEKSTDGMVKLDEQFIVPTFDINASEVLARFLSEISNRFLKRSELIAERIGRPGQGGVAEVSDFLMLQVLNRYSAHMAHLSRIRGLHPETFYSMLVQALGELSTFSENHLVPVLPAYDHEHPTSCFRDLVFLLNRYLSAERASQAESLPIQSGRFGLKTIPVHDSRLFEPSDFVFAIKSALSQEELSKNIQQKIKISSIENIGKLVNLAMPGISFTQLPVAPRQLPFHAGFSYFQLNVDNEFRASIPGSTGFGMHVAGDFPELQLEFWSINH